VGSRRSGAIPSQDVTWWVQNRLERTVVHSSAAEQDHRATGSPRVDSRVAFGQHAGELVHVFPCTPRFVRQAPAAEIARQTTPSSHRPSPQRAPTAPAEAPAARAASKQGKGRRFGGGDLVDVDAAEAPSAKARRDCASEETRDHQLAGAPAARCPRRRAAAAYAGCRTGAGTVAQRT